jgi:hypothetical protein
MGAFLYIADTFREHLGVNLAYIGRAAAASPATSSEYAHKHQQSDILDAAIAPVQPADASGNGQAKQAGARSAAASAKH